MAHHALPRIRRAHGHVGHEEGRWAALLGSALRPPERGLGVRSMLRHQSLREGFGSPMMALLIEQVPLEREKL